MGTSALYSMEAKDRRQLLRDQTSLGSDSLTDLALGLLHVASLSQVPMATTILQHRLAVSTCKVQSYMIS